LTILSRQITVLKLGLNQKNLSLTVIRLDVNKHSTVKNTLGKKAAENKIINGLTNSAHHKLFSPIGDLTSLGLRNEEWVN
jgi:hypothetical protein